VGGLVQAHAPPARYAVRAAAPSFFFFFFVFVVLVQGGTVVSLPLAER
jgi:hypothetical protein